MAAAKQKVVIRVQVPPDRNYAFSVDTTQNVSASMESICKKVGPSRPFTEYTLCFHDGPKQVLLEADKPFGEQLRDPIPEFQLHLLPQFMAAEMIRMLGTSDPKILKDCMFKLKTYFNDEHFVEAFIEQDGIPVLISVVVEIRGSTQGYGLQALRSVMVYESAMTKFTDTRELTERLIPLLDSKTTSVSRQVLELLIVICDNCGFKLIHDAIKCTARYAGLEPYENLINILGSGDLDTKVNCLALMNTLLHRAPNRQKATKLQHRWEKLGLLSRLRQDSEIKAQEYQNQLTLFKDFTDVDLSEEAALRDVVAAETIANISPFLSEYESQQPRILLLREELHRMHSTFYEAITQGGFMNVFAPTQRFDETTNILSQEPMDHPVNLSILDQILNWDPSQVANPDSASPRLIFTCTPLSQKYEPVIDHELAPMEEAIPEVPYTQVKSENTSLPSKAVEVVVISTSVEGHALPARLPTIDKAVQVESDISPAVAPVPSIVVPSISISTASSEDTNPQPSVDSSRSTVSLAPRKPARVNSIGRQGLGASLNQSIVRETTNISGAVLQNMLNRTDAAPKPQGTGDAQSTNQTLQAPSRNSLRGSVRLSARFTAINPISAPVPAPPPPPPAPGVPGAPGMPPPPPPPGMSLAPKPTKPVVKPNATMKPLHWKRILNPPQNVQRGEGASTVWESIQEPSLNFEAFETLFKMKQSEVSTADPKAGNQKPVDVRRVLDPKRSYMIGIRMARLPTVEVILEALASLDENKLTVEDLQGLISCAPTSDEIDLLLAPQAEELPFDKPEQFLLQINKIQKLEDRIKCWITKRQFRETIDTVGRPLVTLQRACKETKNSTSLRTVLGIILACGNYMNGGNTSRGQADGFHLSNLSLLTTVKDSSNASNLLQFVVNQVKERYPEALKLPDELSLVKEASTISLTTIGNDLQKIIKDLSSTRMLAEGVVAIVPRSDPFVVQIPKFLAEADKQLSNIQKQLHDTTQSFHDLLSFFGLSKQQFSQETSEDYFMNLTNFAIGFKQYAAVEDKPKPKVFGRKIGGVQREGEDPMAAVVQSIRLNISQRGTVKNLE